MKWLLTFLCVAACFALPPTFTTPAKNPQAQSQSAGGIDLTSIAFWYKFDDGSGTSVADSSGQGITGTISGSAAWGTGHSGGALLFDGTDDRVEFTLGSDLGTAHTTMFWLSYSNAADAVIIGENDDAGADQGYGAYIGGPGAGDSIYYHASENAAGLAGVVHGGLTAGTSNHFAIVRLDTTTVRFFKNGVQIGTDQTLSNGGVGALALKSVGAYGNGSYWLKGWLDQIYVFRRVLSDAEISAEAAR